MHRDQEIELPTAGGEDGEWVRSGEGRAHREIGELLLRVDELEDTLHVMESRPELHDDERFGTGPAALRRIEAQIRTERAKIEELERRGPIRYDAVERAIRLSDAIG